LTSDTVWNLRELPRRLVVLGGGPIGRVKRGRASPIFVSSLTNQNVLSRKTLGKKFYPKKNSCLMVTWRTNMKMTGM